MARGQDAMSWPLAAPGNDLLAAARCRHRRAWPGRKLADDGSGTMEGAGAFREERKIPEVAWNERQPGYEGHREDIRADRRAVLPRDKPVRGRRRALPHLDGDLSHHREEAPYRRRLEGELLFERGRERGAQEPLRFNTRAGIDVDRVHVDRPRGVGRETHHFDDPSEVDGDTGKRRTSTDAEQRNLWVTYAGSVPGAVEIPTHELMWLADT